MTTIVVLGSDQISVIAGTEGPAGKSAYLAAVSAGFVGTEAEWLASLKGDPGDSALTDPGDLTLIFNNGLI